MVDIALHAYLIFVTKQIFQMMAIPRQFFQKKHSVNIKLFFYLFEKSKVLMLWLAIFRSLGRGSK